MNCPNINIKSVINEFNDIIAAFGGRPMTIEEFRSKDVRNMRSGVDNSAMQIAYYVWDKTNGEGLAALPEYINSAETDDMQRIRNVVNEMLGVKWYRSDASLSMSSRESSGRKSGSGGNISSSSKIDEIKKEIYRDLPQDIADSVEIVETVPAHVIGRRDIYLAMKDILERKGISDPFLINWVGINKADFGNFSSLESEKQILDIIKSRYSEKVNTQSPEFEINKIAKDSFEKWIEALDEYPLAFKDLMLKHALKHLLNPDRRSKYVLQLSKIALRNTYEIAVDKPYELNRIGKLYDMEVIKLTSDATNHERSASGNGYWIHIPRSSYRTGTYEGFVNEHKNQIRSLERERALILEKLNNPDELKERVNFLNDLIRRLSNGETVLYSQEIYLYKDAAAQYGVDNYDYVRLENTFSRAPGARFSVLEDLNYSGYYIHAYNTRNQDGDHRRVIKITNDEAEAIFNKHIESSPKNFIDSITTTYINLLRSDILELDENRLSDRVKDLDRLILNIENTLTSTPESLWSDEARKEYKSNVELLRRLSPSTWCTSSGMADHYVSNFDNYLLIVNGVTVAGIEAMAPVDGLQTQVAEVTSRNNNGIASIDHLDDILDFFEKHNLNKNNATIERAIQHKKDGFTDRSLMRSDDPDHENWYYQDPFEIDDRVLDYEDLRDPEFDIDNYDDYDDPNYNEYDSVEQEIGAMVIPLIEDAVSIENAKDAIEFLKSIFLSENNVIPFGYSHLFKRLIWDINHDLYEDYELAKLAIDIDPHAISLVNHNASFYMELARLAVEGNYATYRYLSDEAKTDEDLTAKYHAGVESEYLLPFSINKENSIQGYYDPRTDKVAIVAENIDPSEASRIAIHEVAHRGMIRMAKELGGTSELYAALFAAKKQLFRKLPELLRRTGHDSFESLILDYGFEVDSVDGQAKVLMELAARWAETLINKPKPSWWRRLILDIKSWLKAFVGVDLTEAHVDSLVGGFVEYGTKKRESSKSPIDQEILSRSSIYDEYMKPLQKAIQSIKRQFGLPESGDIFVSKRLLYRLKKQYSSEESPFLIHETDNTRKDVDFYGQDDIRIEIRLKKWKDNEVNQAVNSKFESQFESNKKPEIRPITRDESLEIISDRKSRPRRSRKGHLKDDSGLQLDMTNDLFNFAIDRSNPPTNQSLSVILKLADRLYERFGVRYRVLSRAEADRLLSKDGKPVDTLAEGINGFFNPADNTAYIIEGSLKASTTVHELFGHAFLNILKSSPELTGLYNKLASEAAKYRSEVLGVSEAYYGSDGSIMADEAILAVLGLSIDKLSSRPSLRQAVDRFYEFVTSILNKVFGKSNLIKSIRPNATIESIARWALYGTDKLTLVGGSQAISISNAVSSLSSKFSSVSLKNNNDRLMVFSDMLSILDKDGHGDIIASALEEFDPVSPKQAIEIIDSKLNSVDLDGGIIYNPNGEVVGNFKHEINGKYLIISSISTNNISISQAVSSILEAMKDMNQIILAIPDNLFFADTIEYITKESIVPNHATAITKIDDNQYFIINKGIKHDDGIVFSKSKVSSSTISISSARNFVSHTTDGLRSQLKEMERRGTFSPAEMERVRSLIDKLNNTDELGGVLAFIDHSFNEVAAIENKIDEMLRLQAIDEDVSNEELQNIKTNFLGLYKNAMQAIESIAIDPSGVLKTLSSSDMNNVKQSIDSISKKMNHIEAGMANLSRYVYVNSLKNIGDTVGSDTIDQKIGSEEIGVDSNGRPIFNDIYLEPKDISGIASFIFGLSKSDKEQLRALAKIVGDVNSQVSLELENGEVGRMLKNLTDKWNAVRKKHKFARYESAMEKIDGKFTGALISDTLHGKFKADYRDFRESMRVKYGLKDANDIPADTKKMYEYLNEVDSWLSENAERRFNKEYYNLRARLSIEAREAMDAASRAVSSYLRANDLLDEDGHPATEKMSIEQRAQYDRLRLAKKAMSMTRYPDGSPKIEGSVAYNIAIELQEFNKVLRENLKYTPNLASFEAKRARMEKELSAPQYRKWLKDNQKIEYDQSFWDAMEQLKEGAADQPINVQNAIDERSAILTMFKDPDTMEINAERLDSEKIPGDHLKTYADRIKELDKYIAKNRTKGDKSAYEAFNAIAESVPTAEFLRMETAARLSSDPMAWPNFMEKTHFIGARGKMTRYSQYSKLEPKNKKLIRTVPNNFWGELDIESNFVNKNYSEDRAEDGMQPSRAKYDNSAEYNKVMSDPVWADFINSVRDAYKMLNKHYNYLENPNSLMLAQIPGGFLRRMVSGDNILKGIKNAIADEFVYRSYDPGFGDYNTQGMFRADGSPTMFVPTRHRKLLDNPNEISRDLLGALALYARSAVNYSYMTKKEAEIATLLDGIKSTRVSGNDKGTPKSVAAGETRMYKLARDYVESNVYGRGASRYDLFIEKNSTGFLPKILTKAKLMKKTNNPDSNEYIRFSMAKPIIAFINYAKKINLSMNVRAIVTNRIGAGLHMKIEANLGSAITNKTWWFANNELVANMPKIMASSLTNRSDNKIISLMRMFNIVRSIEADMKGMHGVKLLNFMSSNIHYGPYSAGDFSVKGRMMIGVLANVKMYDGVFYTRDQFANKFYKSKRSEGYSVFDNIQETLYSAFEISDKGMLGIKEKYVKAITPDLIANMTSMMGTLARKLDGTMSGAEKTRMHQDAFAQAILLHRGWLLNALSERFHPKIYDYEKQMTVSGLYRGENVSTAVKLMGKFLGAKLADARRLNIKGLASMKFGELEDSFESGQVYQAKRIINELSMLVALSIITTIIGKMVPLKGDSPEKLKKDDETWQMWLYVFMLRTSMEFYALYSPGDVYGIVGSPTAAEGTMNNIQETFKIAFDGTHSDLISSGRYKYKTKLERAIIKSLPGVKQVYENIISPDLQSIEKFILKNIPGELGVYRHVINPDTELEKGAKEIRQLRIKFNKAKFDARKRAAEDSSTEE